MSVLCLWPFKTCIWFKFSSPNVIFFFFDSRGGGTQKEFLMKRRCHHILQELPVKSNHPFPYPIKNERTLNKRVWKGLTENWKNRLKFDWQLTFALEFTVNWQRAWLAFNYFLQNLFLRPFNSMIPIFSSDKVIKCAFIWELSGRTL